MTQQNLSSELGPHAVFFRKLRTRDTYRIVLYVHMDGRIVYTTPSGRKGACSARTFLRWAGALRRFTPKDGPLL